MIDTVADLQASIGTELGVSEWILIDQPMIDAFADATGDHQYIHVDPEKAALSPFGSTIAHGFLTLSLGPLMADKGGLPRPKDMKMGVNYGINRLRFLAPVRPGSRVRGRFKLLNLEEKRPKQFQQTLELTIEIEGADKPAIVTEWITQFFV